MRKRAAALAALLALPAAVAFSAFWRRRPPEPAGWTGPFTPDEYRRFLNVIALYFGVRQGTISVKDGELTVEGAGGPRREHLSELAALCHGQPPERWPELIARHFDLQAGAKPAPAPELAATPPVWVPPAVAERGPRGDWAAFRGMVQECFRRYGLDATVEADGVVARDGAGREHRFDAPGLDRGPLELARAEWPRFIDGCFGELLRALRGREALAGRSYEDVRELLAVQLYDETWLSARACRDTVFSRDLPGLISAVVCRLPQATFLLSPETAGAWGREEGEVMAAGLANLRRLRPPMQRVMLAPGAEGMRFESQGPFGAAQALTLADYAECGGRYGALVAVPRRQLLLVCPLRGGRGAAHAANAAAMALVSRIRQSEWEGHTPLSRSLYWYRDGCFSALPYEVETRDGRAVVEFTPPVAWAGLAEVDAEAL